MFGKLNLRGISTRAMLSVKGESVYELIELFLISAGIPGILQIRSSILLSMHCNSASCVFDGNGTLMAFGCVISLEDCTMFDDGLIGSFWF